MGIILMLLCEIFIFFRHLTWKCSYLIVIDMYDAKVLFCMQCVQKIWITVKLEIKELLNKEQTGFKELCSEYQLLYTINPLLNKELLPIYEMPILGISEHKIVKINKNKVDFRKNFDKFWDFTLKRAPIICDPRIIWKPFGTKLRIDCKKDDIFSWFFIRYYFQLKRHFWGILCQI